jgi:hypothetical protein
MFNFYRLKITQNIINNDCLILWKFKFIRENMTFLTLKHHTISIQELNNTLNR